jgi:hypothetical protein
MVVIKAQQGKNDELQCIISGDRNEDDYDNASSLVHMVVTPSKMCRRLVKRK